MLALFESLATLSVRVYAAHSEARVKHLRTARGRQEIDLIVERADGSVVAIEVKLARTVSTKDTKHLTWLKQTLGDRVLDQVILTTGPTAYRREPRHRDRPARAAGTLSVFGSHDPGDQILGVSIVSCGSGVGKETPERRRRVAHAPSEAAVLAAHSSRLTLRASSNA